MRMMLSYFEAPFHHCTRIGTISSGIFVTCVYLKLNRLAYFSILFSCFLVLLREFCRSLHMHILWSMSIEHYAFLCLFVTGILRFSLYIYLNGIYMVMQHLYLFIYSFSTLLFALRFSLNCSGTYRKEKKEKLVQQKGVGLLLYIIKEGKRPQMLRVELLWAPLLRLL